LGIRIKPKIDEKPEDSTPRYDTTPDRFDSIGLSSVTW